MGDGAEGGLPKKEATNKNTNCLGHKQHIYFTSGYLKLAGVHPRHPPRAFPLWLLAPRCLGMGTAQIPGK